MVSPSRIDIERGQQVSDDVVVIAGIKANPVFGSGFHHPRRTTSSVS